MGSGVKDDTVKINRHWWEYLTTGAIRHRLPEVNALLKDWCQTTYGRLWLQSAVQKSGVVRARVGDKIPTVHLIALDEDPFFIGQQMYVTEEGRSIGPTQFGSGRQLEEGEVALQPQIVIELVTDRALLQAVQRGEWDSHVERVTIPAQLFSLPAHLLLAPRAETKRAYVIYQHIFGAGSSYPVDGYFYVGVTKRSWRRRWAEHLRGINGQSNLLFHRTFRDEREAGRITYVNHKVMGVTSDLDELYEQEELLVEAHWHDQRRLNMIPGGKSGIAYLRKNGLLTQTSTPTLEERDRSLELLVRNSPRKGVPAPWASEVWNDNKWAVEQICGREGRLTVQQVRSIRDLAATHAPSEIAVQVGAKNKRQVEGVLRGRTYSRVT